MRHHYLSLIWATRAFCCYLLLACSPNTGGLSWQLAAQERPAHLSKPYSSIYFYRKLIDRNPTVRSAARRRIHNEFAGTDEAAATILKVLDQTTQDSRRIETSVALIGLLNDFEQKSVLSTLVRLLSSHDLRIAVSAVNSLKHHNRSDTLAPILAMTERKEFLEVYGFRTAILDAVISFRSIQSVTTIVDQLPRLTGQSEKQAFRYLSMISGLPAHENKGEWTRWWAGTDKQTFVFNEEPVKRARPKRPQDNSQSEFFDLAISAKRFVFVIDKSNSMSKALNIADMLPANNQNVIGKQIDQNVETRLSHAKQELDSAIFNLDAESFFSVVAFDGRFVAWRTKLVPANVANKNSASRFIASLEASGETAWFDVLDATLRMDKNLEAIFFLSDGMPTAGRIVSASQILEAIQKENKFRRVSIHTIGLGVNRTAEHFLRKLARISDGDYRSLGTGEAAILEKTKVKPDAKTFVPKRVINRAMPPITRLNVVSAKVADRRIKRDELVLGVVIGNESRAYPLNGLTGPNREIFNDTLGGIGIAATW